MCTNLGTRPVATKAGVCIHAARLLTLESFHGVCPFLLCQSVHCARVLIQRKIACPCQLLQGVDIVSFPLLSVVLSTSYPSHDIGFLLQKSNKEVVLLSKKRTKRGAPANTGVM